MYLRGLLPPAVLSQAVQAERVMMNLQSLLKSNLDKHQYLMALQVREGWGAVGGGGVQCWAMPS